LPDVRKFLIVFIFRHTAANSRLSLSVPGQLQQMLGGCPLAADGSSRTKGCPTHPNLCLTLPDEPQYPCTSAPRARRPGPVRLSGASIPLDPVGKSRRHREHWEHSRPGPASGTMARPRIC
jgi:hypothetical protein